MFSAASSSASSTSSPSPSPSAPISPSPSLTYNAPAPAPTPAFERWRQNLAWITGFGLTSAEQEQRTRENGQKLEVSLLKRCEKLKNGLVENSPKIRFMFKHLKHAGYPISSEHIRCISCNAKSAPVRSDARSSSPTTSTSIPPSSLSSPSNIPSSSTSSHPSFGDLPPNSGGFSTKTGDIILCTNVFHSKSHMEDVITHELIHLYDHVRFRVDWSDLRHHACSEIRASSLSGDCRWSRELNRFFFGFSKQHQACTRRRATISVAANSACPNKAAAEQAVNEVWESCFRDTRPFDEVKP